MDTNKMREQLQEIRKQKKLSYVKLAKEVGINAITLTAFLRENKETSDIVLFKIEEYIKGIHEQIKQK